MLTLIGGNEMAIPGGPVMHYLPDCRSAEGNFPISNFSGPGPTPGVTLTSLLSRDLPIQGSQDPGSVLRLEANPNFSIAERVRHTGAESIEVYKALPALPTSMHSSQIVEVRFRSHLGSSTITPWIAFMVLD